MRPTLHHNYLAQVEPNGGAAAANSAHPKQTSCVWENATSLVPQIFATTVQLAASAVVARKEAYFPPCLASSSCTRHWAGKNS